MSDIVVPKSFVDDFNFVMAHYGVIGCDSDDIRKSVRAHFNTDSVWVTETAALLRWMTATWRGMPTPDLCRGYMAACRHWPADDTVFQRWGILLLVRECWRLRDRYQVADSVEASA
jgi:hypothetical protein